MIRGYRHPLYIPFTAIPSRSHHCIRAGTMPCTFCGQYMHWEEGKIWEKHYIFSDRNEQEDIRQGHDGRYWVLWDSGEREQVYWYTPSECTRHKTKWPLLWFLQCGRCKQKRDHARRMQDLATRKQRRMHHILRLLEYEEGRILRNILWRWRRPSYGWPLCAAPPADRTL